MRRVLNLLQSAHMSYTHLQGAEGGGGGQDEVIIGEYDGVIAFLISAALRHYLSQWNIHHIHYAP
ncbi:hypothetical protein EON63_15570 [archaeon]|nr:MAG: hypothetical protein EON63_15570 [archaeon]